MTAAYVVFGLSALLVPIWLLLEWRRKAAERARLNERLFQQAVETGKEMPDDER